jgi:hypothetical protein
MMGTDDNDDGHGWALVDDDGHGWMMMGSFGR